VIEDLGKVMASDSQVDADPSLMKMLEKGIIAKDTFGISNEKIEALYSQAYILYNTGKFRDAIGLFRILIMLDPSEARYLIGLAASYHLLKEYRNAIKTYTICLALDPNNPIPFFHLSDCYYQINDKASALVTLNMAVKRAENKPEYQILKDRALLTMTSIKKDIENILSQQNLDVETNLA
jgi:type III secretion system low calcium response chaperone LcrH/SycD